MMRIAARFLAVLLGLVGVLAGGCSLAFTPMLIQGGGIGLAWIVGLLVAAGSLLGARAIFRKTAGRKPEDPDKFEGPRP